MQRLLQSVAKAIAIQAHGLLERKAQVREGTGWLGTTGDWIDEKLGRSAYVRLIKVRMQEQYNAGSDRVRLYLMLTLVGDNLEKLIESSAWD
jgi:hypothetical protein